MTPVAVRGGTCRSPLSSDDDAEVEPEVEEDVVMLDVDLAPPAPPKRRSAGRGTAVAVAKRAQRKPKPSPKAIAAPATKPRARSSSGSGQSKKATSIPDVQVRTAPLPAVRSTKELIADADDKLVEFLAEQLDEHQQAQLAREFGFGQGYLVKTPGASASAWKRTKDRARLASWLQALGFTPLVSVSRFLYRIASLRADVILHELRRRVLPATAADGNDDEQVDTTAPSGTDRTDPSAVDAPVSMDALADDPSLQSYKAMFSALDAQSLEIVSLSEHDRMLSSTRHMEIADAMEDVLAQPSVRKEKSRARRLSRLGRIAGRRRISIVPLSQSTVLPSLLEDDVAWDDSDAEEGNDDRLGPLPRASSVGMTRDSVSLSLGGGGRLSSLGGGASGKVSVSEGRASSLSIARGASGRHSSVEPRQHVQLKQEQQRKLLLDNVLRLVLHARMLPVQTLRRELRQVSSSWRHISIVAYAWVMADYANQPRKSMVDVYMDYPRGHYLSDGAYKEVHKVYSTRDKRLEAVSVMDIGAIASTGNQSIVRQEIAHTILLSELVESAFCPNFVQIYDLFVSSDGPRPDRWGSAEHRRPSDILTDRRLSVDPASLASRRQSSASQSTSSSSLYQYIQMEFCDGGDLEDFISLQREQVLPVDSVVVPFFFQMAFSVYCARERFAFRHCDLKLLNFFLKDISRPGLATSSDDNDDVVLQYHVEVTAFELRLPASFAYWIKMADYGTAESDAETLGKPVALDQFTTLENSPIEFLLAGDAAVQSFAGDTFSLGLSLLHLFTGSAPYEEILDSVRCPPKLLKDLQHIWTSPRKTSGFSVLRRIVKDDHENVLYHTLYRYLVLFGLPDDNPSETNRVWDVLLKHLRPDAAPAAAMATRRSRSATASARAAKPADSVAQRFELDCALYSLAHGADATIARARARMAAVDGAMALLTSLVHFDPTQRPSMKRVLLHPFFASLRVQEPELRVADYVVDAYKRVGGTAVVPDV